MKERKEQFQKLLEEAGLHGKYVVSLKNFRNFRNETNLLFRFYNKLIFFLSRSSFSDFAQKHGRDERFKNVEKMRERESLFNEYLLEVRKKEKEEKTAKREQVFSFY